MVQFIEKNFCGGNISCGVKLVVVNFVVVNFVVVVQFIEKICRCGNIIVVKNWW